VDGKIAFIADLPIDGKYYLTEISAPNGYVNAGEKKELTFTYEGSDKDLLSYSFTFVNEPTTVEVSKTDITDGKEIESWVSEEKPHYIEKLPVGDYTLREVTAPDGYEVAEDVKFKVEETGEIQHVVMKDAPKKQPETTPTTEKPTTPDNPTNPTTPSTETPKKETPTTPKTGDNRNPLIWLLLFGIGGCMAGAAWYLRKKDEKDQNQD